MTANLTSREIRLADRPVGEPGAQHFELVHQAVPPLAEGQILVRNTWMSVDPYMRGRMDETPSYLPAFQLGVASEGSAVGEVVDSRSGAIPLGTTGLTAYAALTEVAPVRSGDTVFVSGAAAAIGSARAGARFALVGAVSYSARPVRRGALRTGVEPGGRPPLDCCARPHRHGPGSGRHRRGATRARPGAHRLHRLHAKRDRRVDIEDQPPPS